VSLRSRRRVGVVAERTRLPESSRSRTRRRRHCPRRLRSSRFPARRQRPFVLQKKTEIAQVDPMMRSGVTQRISDDPGGRERRSAGFTPATGAVEKTIRPPVGNRGKLPGTQLRDDYSHLQQVESLESLGIPPPRRPRGLQRACSAPSNTSPKVFRSSPRSPRPVSPASGETLIPLPQVPLYVVSERGRA
jgi:hypothetical protein